MDFSRRAINLFLVHLNYILEREISNAHVNNNESEITFPFERGE